MDDTGRGLRRFFVLAFAIAWAITIPIALQVQGILPWKIVPPPAQWLIGFAPAVAAFIAARGLASRAEFVADARRVAVGGRWYLLALLVPWALLGADAAARSVGGLTPVTVRGGFATLALAGVWLILGWGEEAGWRAFALPRLVARYGVGRAVMLLGVVWCVWHYPKLFSSPYLHADAAGLKMIGLFSLQILVASATLAWVFLKTRSAPVTAVFHMSWNTVSTVYSMAAVDPLLTTGLALFTVAALVVAPVRTTGPTGP